MNYLFANCSNIKTINLGYMNTESLNAMQRMFCYCHKLESIDLSSFDTTLVTHMGWVFFHCYEIKYIILSESFKTSNVISMYSMFSHCKSIISLNLSSFDTTKVTQMCWMFNTCRKLKYLDISNFAPLNLTDIDTMFNGMSDLVYLNIHSLEINNLTNTNKSFNALPKDLKICSNQPLMQKLLTSLHRTYNCSDTCFEKGINLDITKNKCINSCKDNEYNYTNNGICYNQCPEDAHVIIKNINNKNNIIEKYDNNNEVTKCFYSPIGYYLDGDRFYKECFENCRFCYGPGDKDDNNCILCKKNFVFLDDSLIKTNCYEKCEYYYYFNETYHYICTENCSGTYDKVIIEKKKCIDNCHKDNIYKYEYDKICYEKCPNGTIYNEEEGICIKEKEFVETTFINNVFSSLVSTQININISNTFKITEFSTILNKKFISTGNLLTEVVSTYLQNINETDMINNTFLSTSIIEAITQINQKNESNKQISKYINQSEFIYGTTKFVINGNNEEIYQSIIDNIIQNYNKYSGEEMSYRGEDNFFFDVINTQNELDILKGKSNSTNKFSIIDFGECENLLKRNYKINENTSLIIIKFEKITNISSERLLQFEVYDPYTKKKLNLSICSNITIDIYIPVILSEKIQNLYNELKDLGYDLFDINSPFYQDICTPYKSSDGTDVTLNDRVNYFYNNNETTCQSNCKFSDYLMDSQYVKCDCEITNSEINIRETEKFSAKSIYESFFSVLKYSNYKVLKCARLTFTINSLTINIGSILSIIYFLIFFVFLIIYILKGITQLKTEITKSFSENSKKKKIDSVFNIKELIENIKYKEKKRNKINSYDLMKEFEKEGNQKYLKESKYRQNIKAKNNNQVIFILRTAKRKKKRNQRIVFTYPPKKIFTKFKEKKIDSKNILNISNDKGDNNGNILITNKGSSSISSKKNGVIYKNKDINKQIFDVMNLSNKEREELDSYELNNSEYDIAKELDKRNFLQIYWSLLKREHLIIFTFITKDDHNIVFIKYSRFIFLLCTDMAMNVFFFADETMHKMFLDYGKYNFIQQIPQIAYSTLISKLIEIFLCYLSLTDKHYYQIKDSKRISKSSMIGIMKCIQIKIGFFFGFTTLMFIFYWYLITCFCAVYQNTQTAFIKDSLLSFLLGNLIPFGIYLIPSLLRIISLKSKKFRFECVYNLSNVIPCF